jgi:hypothetical protein
VTPSRATGRVRVAEDVGTEPDLPTRHEEGTFGGVTLHACPSCRRQSQSPNREFRGNQVADNRISARHSLEPIDSTAITTVGSPVGDHDYHH